MKKFLIIILIVMFLFNGLANERELNKLSIVSCIGIDIAEDGQYEVCVNILNTKKTGDASQQVSEKELSTLFMYKIKEKSIQEALRNIIKESPKRLYLAHVKLVMVSEKLAKERMMDTLDYFIRDYEGGNNFVMVVTKDSTPNEVMEKMAAKTNDFATEIRKSILNLYKYRGNSTDDLLNDNLRKFLGEGQEVVINSIELVEDEINNSKEDEKEKEEESKKDKSYKIKISDMAYFKGYEIKGYLEENDNITYNILQNELKTTLIQLGEKQDRIVIEVIDANSKMTPSIKEQIPNVKIDLKMVCNITEIGQNIKIEDENDLGDIENRIKQKMINHINNYINNCRKKYNSDIIQIGNLFYRYENKYYMSVKDVFYTKIYNDITYDIDINVTIPNLGGVKKQW